VIGIIAALVVAAAVVPLRAQPVDSAIAGRVDTTRPWYDTLAVMKPRYARATLGERMALAAFTALALPVGIVVGATTVIPPTVSMLDEHGERHVGISCGTGLGFGGDAMSMTYYPDFRAQLDIGYYFDRERPVVMHVGVLKDLVFATTDRRGLMNVGVAAGAGVMIDFHTYRPYVEGFAGLLNPLGIQFVPLFPMHTYGLRVRFGYDPAASRTWYEVGIGMTSTLKR
jgi:hypothetical protein